VTTLVGVRSPEPSALLWARLQQGYLWFVGVGGSALAAAVVAAALLQGRIPASRPLAVMTLLVILAEIRPIVVIRRSHTDAVTTSTIFVFAILLQWGLAAALLAQGIASLIDDGRDRSVSLRTTLFNVGQYTLALTAAAVVLRALPFGVPAPLSTPEELVVVGAAAVVFMTLNYFLPGIDIALEEGGPLWPALTADFGFHASVNGVLLALAPVVVIATQHSAAVLPLLGLPMAFVYRSTRTAVDKQHMALHDGLTDLPNRAYFNQHADELLRSLDLRSEKLAVVVIDVDDFKEVNDTLGHHVGDALLQQIGDRLREATPSPWFAARMGGDEFAILLPGVGASAETEQAVTDIVACLDQPFVLDDLRFQLHVSAGVAVAPDDGVDINVLLQRADVAMYVAKRHKSGFERYEAARDQHSLRRLAMMSELREAIADESLLVYYQPQADMISGRIRSAEALVRWRHPRFGLVPPDEFIALAEQTGVIRDVTRYVLKTALRDVARWQRQGYAIGVAVNVSSRDVRDDDFVADVVELLERFGVEPSALEIEITESALMEDIDRTVTVLNQLRDLGVCLAVDDYGTGYASLGYLSRLPVDSIKIDRSFVGGMTTQRADALIVGSTIDLARNLGITVVAEGVETAAVWGSLKALGCGVAQGFYLSRAVPEQDLRDQLRVEVSLT
jgi:diguanylate cyclase (GGDEF)-like protein